jgi:hypothetical protein
MSFSLQTSTHSQGTQQELFFNAFFDCFAQNHKSEHQIWFERNQTEIKVKETQPNTDTDQ